MQKEIERTSAKDIGYALYLYFLGLCYRNTSKALPDLSEGVMCLSVWKWVQYTTDQKEYIFQKKENI